MLRTVFNANLLDEFLESLRIVVEVNGKQYWLDLFVKDRRMRCSVKVNFIAKQNCTNKTKHLTEFN